MFVGVRLSTAVDELSTQDARTMAEVRGIVGAIDRHARCCKDSP